jgi:hypothetical protein
MAFGIHIHIRGVNLNPVGRWMGNAVKTAGRPIGAIAHGVQGVEGAVGRDIAKLPLVGKPLHAMFDLTTMAILGPALTLGDVLGGQRIDQAILGDLKRELQDVKDIAPYAEAVIAFVPGIGPGVAGALGAGLALASGQSITKAMEEGIKDAIPGGAIAVAIYQVAKTSIDIAKTHKFTIGDVVALGGAAAAAVGVLPDNVQQALTGVLGPVGDAVQGVQSAVGQAETAMGPLKGLINAEAHKALQIGISIGHGKFLQSAAMPGLTDQGLRNRLMALGQSISASDPVVGAARKSLSAGFVGFDVSVGLTRQVITPHQFQVIRAFFQGPDLHNFDFAMSLHVGRVAQPTPPTLQSAKNQVGYFTTMGLQGAPTASKVVALNTIDENPVMKLGATVAIGDIARTRASWLSRFWHWLTGSEHSLA